MRAMRCLVCVLLFSALTPCRADQPKEMMRIHALVLDWRGRPALGATISVTVIRHLQGATAFLSNRIFKVERADGRVDLDGPMGTWKIEARREGKRFGHATLESNAPKFDPAPEFTMTKTAYIQNPFVIHLRVAEWNDDRGTEVWQLDMTSPTQGQTYRSDEWIRLPIR